MTGCAGSLRYMAPEVVLRQPYNEKVDVYSFGMVMWQMLRNEIPFRHLYRDDFLEHVIQKQERPSLLEITKYSPALAALLTECWDELPSKRPSFHEISIRLMTIINEKLYKK